MEKNLFAMELTKGILSFGQIKCIECDEYFDEPKERCIKVVDVYDNAVVFPLEFEEQEDWYLVLLNLMFQKILYQLGMEGNDFWLLDISNIDDVLNILKEKVPFRTLIVNELYQNM